MELYWSIVTLSCVISLCAVVLAHRRYREWHTRHTVTLLSAKINELLMAQEKYAHQQTKLISRLTMRERREKEKESSTNGLPAGHTDGEAWKQSVSGIKR